MAKKGKFTPAEGGIGTVIWWSFWAIIFVVCLLGYAFGGIDPLHEFDPLPRETAP
jgi:hypothetical protein